jgi:hypothetical protein
MCDASDGRSSGNGATDLPGADTWGISGASAATGAVLDCASRAAGGGRAVMRNDMYRIVATNGTLNRTEDRATT